jgi:hypothetical protein
MKHVPQKGEDGKPSPKKTQLAMEEEQRSGASSPFVLLEHLRHGSKELEGDTEVNSRMLGSQAGASGAVMIGRQRRQKL